MLYPENLSALRERARSGRTCLGVHCSTMSPQTVELMGLLGLDYVIVSTEVESIDPSRVEDLLRAADASKTVPMVKLRRNAPELVSDALNAGAPLVMVPHVRTRTELEAAISASRFAPLGTRGLCPAARYAGFGSRPVQLATQLAHESISVIPIIEDKEALGHLDELFDVPGVEIYEIGPFDLSHSLGVPPDRAYENPETLSAIEKICAAAARHGKSLLAPLWLPREPLAPQEIIERQVRELVARGINMLYHADVVMLARAFRELLPVRDAGGRR